MSERERGEDETGEITHERHVRLGDEIAANGGSSLVVQATALSLSAAASPVLGVSRVERRDEGVGVELGERKSGYHVEVVLLPVEVEDELEHGTGGGDGASFDGVANEAAQDLVGGCEARAGFSQLDSAERGKMGKQLRHGRERRIGGSN